VLGVTPFDLLIGSTSDGEWALSLSFIQGSSARCLVPNLSLCHLPSGVAMGGWSSGSDSHFIDGYQRNGPLEASFGCLASSWTLTAADLPIERFSVPDCSWQFFVVRSAAPIRADEDRPRRTLILMPSHHEAHDDH